MPQTEAAQCQEAGRAHEGLEEDEGPSGEHSEVLAGILATECLGPRLPPPVFQELLVKDLKTESHNEAAADDHEEHVEEEVPVVVVSDTVVEPGTVVVHLEDAGVADTV